MCARSVKLPKDYKISDGLKKLPIADQLSEVRHELISMYEEMLYCQWR